MSHLMAPCFLGLRVGRGKQLLQILEHKKKKKNTHRWASYHWRWIIRNNWTEVIHFKSKIVFLRARNMDMVNNQPTPLGRISKHVQIVHHREHSCHAYIFKMKHCKNWWQISFWRIKLWDSSDSSWAWKTNESMKTEYLHFENESIQ
jgi:hypothetical protein